MLCVVQVEASATSRYLVQSSPTVCVCLCHLLQLQWVCRRDQSRTIFRILLPRIQFPKGFIMKITCMFLVYYIACDRSWGGGRGTLHSSQFWDAPTIFRFNCLWKEVSGLSCCTQKCTGTSHFQNKVPDIKKESVCRSDIDVRETNTHDRPTVVSKTGNEPNDQ
jgi:hypothetical protein